MPTLAELVLALITDQPLARDEKRDVAPHIMQLVRRIRKEQSLSDSGRADFRYK